jgi:hypothetical protein
MFKRHPRTLKEAFPKTVEYGASIEIFGPRYTLADKVFFVLAVIGAIVLLIDLFIWRP